MIRSATSWAVSSRGEQIYKTLTWKTHIPFKHDPSRVRDGIDYNRVICQSEQEALQQALEYNAIIRPELFDQDLLIENIIQRFSEIVVPEITNKGVRVVVSPRIPGLCLLKRRSGTMAFVVLDPDGREVGDRVRTQRYFNSPGPNLKHITATAVQDMVDDMGARFHDYLAGEYEGKDDSSDG